MRTGLVRVRVPVLVARALATLAVALAVVAVVLPLAGGHDYLERLLATPEVAVALSFSVTGAVLVSNPRARLMGWLLLAIGVDSAVYSAAVSHTAFVLGGDAAASLPPGSALAAVTAWVANWAWFPPYVLVLAVLPQVLPYGRPLGGLWRLPLVAAGLILAIGLVSAAVEPGHLSIFTGIDNPAAVPWLSRLLAPLDPVIFTGVLVLAAVALASLAARLLQADAAERRQVGWVGYAVVLAIALLLLLPGMLSNLAVLLVPAGIAVAASRYRLYDLDLVVNRTLVAFLLLGAAAVGYVALVAWVGALVGTSSGAVPFLAAFAVALAFHPARIRLQRWVDRLFFGRRGDPYSLLRDLDRTLRDAGTPRAALADAAHLLRDGLRLTGVEVVVPLPSGGSLRESAGDPGQTATTIPLTLHDEQVGELRAGGRTGGSLGGTDVRVLQVLAGPLASAAYALRLTGDLEDSRRHILETREDERRRLRRDLHDGLGPQLAGVVMGMDVIRSTLSRGEHARADEMAASVGAQARAAVADVRRLVRGLRPPVLDDLGLLGALQAAAPVAQGPPEVRFSTCGDVAGLSAAAEVAAYRIATEAITNAVRHADATTIEVVLAVEADVLSVRVRDDGRGIAPDVRAGVGLVSMRERAAELGGRCTVTATEQGTVVVAELPLAVS